MTNKLLEGVLMKRANSIGMLSSSTAWSNQALVRFHSSPSVLLGIVINSTTNDIESLYFNRAFQESEKIKVAKVQTSGKWLVDKGR
jgi:hypothetical protein